MMPAPLTSPCFTEHAFQRAQERYGVTLLPGDMSDILAACLAGDAPLLKHNSITDIHAVIHKGVRFVVAVRYRRLIITFLPRDADKSDPRLREKPRDHGRETNRREPYKRSKVRMCDLRRITSEDMSA